jgi:hypothetical protein
MSCGCAKFIIRKRTPLQPKLHRLFVVSSDAHIIACGAFIRQNWLACLQAGEPLRVEISQKGDKRSLEQNKRLHCLLQSIAEQAWINGRQYDMETWKEHFRRTLIGTEEINLPDGTRIERGISTTTLSVSEFTSLMDRIEQYASEQLGVVIA